MVDYRYPGLRPFEDTDLDRSLFFGRDREKEELLHLILAEKLTVVFAKSGTGKSSLLNAGILQPLRERDFLPIKVRFNDSRFTPIETVYQAIADTAKQRQIEAPTAEHGALADYFQTAEFWSNRDTLLTPVLILDQFEEFFETYDSAARSELIAQLAECVKNKQFSVKIVIALREDYLAQLEELAPEMPEIFSHRFRLTALRREQAQAAIECPANDFRYAPETIAAMLDFLGKRKERDKIVQTNEIEPFQLQLLCQHVENNILPKKRQSNPTMLIQPDDFGDENGMERILQEFYDKQLKRLGSFWRKRRVRKLCEKGLISATGRRLPAEEEDIQRKYRVSKIMLDELVNARLLRVEPRLGSAYYELSHDTLIKPIRASQKIRRRKSFFVGMLMLIGLCIPSVVILDNFRQKYLTQQEIQQHYRDADLLTFEGQLNEAITHYEKIIAASRFEAKAYLELGAIYMRQNRSEDAQKTYQTAIENGIIEDGRVHYQLGEALSLQYKHEQAIEAYHQALQYNPNLASAYVGLGKAYKNSKIEDNTNIDAEDAYEKALLIDPENAIAYKELATLYIQRKQFDKALAIYQHAASISIECAGIYSDLIWSSKYLPTTQKQTGETKAFVEKILTIAANATFTSRMSNEQVSRFYGNLGNTSYSYGKYEEATTAYRKKIEAMPTDSDAYANLAVSLEWQGKYEEALIVYRKAIEVAPMNPDAYTNLASALEQLGKHEEALIAYRKAIEVDPTDSNVYTSLASVLTRYAENDEALALYRKAIEVAPTNSYGYTGLASALERQGKYDEALPVYRKAIEMAPADSNAYISLASALERQGKDDEALAMYRKAIEVTPTNSYGYTSLASALERQGKNYEALVEYHNAVEIAPMNWYVYTCLASALERQGKNDEALAEYRKAIEVAPADLYGYTSLASALERLGQDDEALVMYRKAIEVAPTNSYGYTSLASALERQGQDDEALTMYRKAIDVAPTNSYGYTSLASALERQGQNDEAIIACRKSIELNPNDSYAYTLLGNISYKQNNHEKAFEYYRIAYQVAEKQNPPLIIALGQESMYSHYNLLVEQFEKAAKLILIDWQMPNLNIESRLRTRLIMVIALIGQGKRNEAIVEIKNFIQSYPSLSEKEIGFDNYNYDSLKNLIDYTKKISDTDKPLLLLLIDILEASKAEGEKKLQELKAQFPELE